MFSNLMRVLRRRCKRSISPGDVLNEVQANAINQDGRPRFSVDCLIGGDVSIKVHGTRGSEGSMFENSLRTRSDQGSGSSGSTQLQKFSRDNSGQAVLAVVEQQLQKLDQGMGDKHEALEGDAEVFGEEEEGEEEEEKVEEKEEGEEVEADSGVELVVADEVVDLVEADSEVEPFEASAAGAYVNGKDFKVPQKPPGKGWTLYHDDGTAWWYFEGKEGRWWMLLDGEPEPWTDNKPSRRHSR